jgi:citrate lyase subunit beta/citryl-CoA lyase
MPGARQIAPEPVSYLFVPGDREDRFEKALLTAADCVVIDLEDAVSLDRKDLARALVREFISHRGTTNRLALRVNAVGTPWHCEDVELLRDFPDLAVMLPKAEPASLERFLADAGLANTPVGQSKTRVLLALVESVDGYLHLREVAQKTGVSRLVFGSVDFHLDAGMLLDEDSAAIAAVRLSFVLESRLAGLPAPVDGVCTAVDDEVRLQRESVRARAAGFSGKLCIHPRQVSGVNAAMRPDADERAWACAVLKAFDAANGSAVQYGGQMIDAPVAERARRVLAACR